MITYICRNKDIKTGEDLPCTNTVCKTSICPSCGQRADAGSQIYWCKSCKTPIYEEVCPICNKKGKKLATDLRPVFPEERLLLEIILGTPFAFLEKSVWNGSGNHYYVDGKRIPFSVKDLKQLNIDKMREEYQNYQEKNTDRYFKEQMEIFLQANRERYEALVEEADEYIRRVAADYNFMEMFVSFSGGKDSTVVSDLVMRALGNPKVLHIFGDTTLEFPFTYTSRKEPHIRTGMEFNRYLSQICEDYYSLAPRINHELLNIQNVQGQYLKARNDVVRAILDGKDLEEYERGSSPQAMVYRAAFLRTGLAGEEFPLDGGCRKIMEEIEDFFVKASGKRVSFQMLYERLQGKDYGVRKGVLPLFLAWKFYLLEGMPVLYLGNKELLITVEVLNNINQFPESYDLYIEKKDMEKELYLQEMEDIFCDAQTEKIIRSNRLSVIMENMQKWYRSLPQYTRVSERYPQEMLYAVRNFRRLLKQTELNPREFLFEQLPNAMDSSKNQMTGLIVREMKWSMDTHFENAIEDTAKEIKKIFGAKESDSLKACLQDWYGRQQNRSKRYVLNKKIKSFMEYVGELNTNDEREIVAVLSKRLEDIYIEDWNDRLQEKFLRDITKIRQKTEAAKEDAGLENGQKEIFLKTADGAEIHKYYDADVKDSTSEFLKNMIEEALDNFGDSLETNQKVAVLAEALEKLLQ